MDRATTDRGLGDDGSRACQRLQSADNRSQGGDKGSWASDGGSREGDDGSQAGAHVCAYMHPYALAVHFFLFIVDLGLTRHFI